MFIIFEFVLFFCMGIFKILYNFNFLYLIERDLILILFFFKILLRFLIFSFFILLYVFNCIVVYVVVDDIMD